jgi:tetratricopeptide (TPR) repeat protein
LNTENMYRFFKFMLRKNKEVHILILTILGFTLLNSAISSSERILGPTVVKQVIAQPSNMLSNNVTALLDNVNKAGALVNLGRNNESLIYSTKALAIDPTNTFALDNKAIALGNLGRNNESLIYSTKALAIDPNNTLALINKAGALANLGRNNESLIYSTKALAMAPTNSVAAAAVPQAISMIQLLFGKG